MLDHGSLLDHDPGEHRSLLQVRAAPPRAGYPGPPRGRASGRPRRRRQPVRRTAAHQHGPRPIAEQQRRHEQRQPVDQPLGRAARPPARRRPRPAATRAGARPSSASASAEAARPRSPRRPAPPAPRGGAPGVDRRPTSGSSRARAHQRRCRAGSRARRSNTTRSGWRSAGGSQSRAVSIGSSASAVPAPTATAPAAGPPLVHQPAAVGRGDPARVAGARWRCGRPG